MTLRIRACYTAALLALVAAGCGDGLAPGEMADVTVTMQQAGDGTVQADAGWSASVAYGGAMVIDRQDVASLIVTVTDVQVLPAAQQDNAGDDGAWVSLDISDVAVDLAQLPTEGLSPMVVASGSLAAGTYRDVRLFLASEAFITFDAAVDLGMGPKLKSGTEYDVTIPSGNTTGIKTGVAFTLENPEDAVNLVFDPDATYLNVTSTGAGGVVLSPVIR